MTIRNFKGADIDALISCFNNALPHNMVEKRTFILKVLLEENFDPNGLFIAEQDDKILGFVNCIYRKVPIDAYSGINKNEGWISVFAINEKERFDEVGEALIDAAENYFASVGVSVISTGYYPLYLFQGFSEEHCPEYIKLFERRGYNGVSSIARELALGSYTLPENHEEKKARIQANGIYVGPMKDEYARLLIDAEEGFGSSGAYEFKIRLLELDYDRFRIAAKDGHIIGVCVFGDPYDSPERFGPFAVKNEYQGMGIGSVLMNEILDEMKKRGLKRTWAQWTPVRGAADAMYKKIGFVRTKTYVTFSKKTEEK